MSIPFPQWDLPYGVRGSSAIDDDGPSGVILAGEFFGPPPSAPSFTVQPTNQSAGVGATATFSATVAGDPTPTLQWQKYVQAPPTVVGGSYTFSDIGTSASPAAVSITVPSNALAVVVHVVGSSDGVSPVNVTGLTTNFTGTVNRVDEPGSLTAVYGCVAWAKVTSTGSGKSLTVTFGGPNTLSGASCTLYFLKDVDPDDFEVAADTAATSDGTTAATASVASLSTGLVIARDVRIDVTNSAVYPSNQSGWTSLTTGLTTATYTNASRLRKLTTPTTGTATATTQDTYGSMVTVISLKGWAWQDISGATSPSYTTPTLVLGDSGTQYRLRASNTGGTVYSNTVTLTVTAGGGTSWTLTPSGSVTLSGTVVVGRGRAFPTSGSVSLTGTNVLVKGNIIVPAGSLAFNGSASVTLQKNIVFSVSGAIALSGTAPIVFSNGSVSYTFTVSGSVLLQGTADVITGRVVTPSGSVSFTGTTLFQKGRQLSTSGQVTFTGTVVTLKGHSLLPLGVVSLSGTAPITFSGTVPVVQTTKLPMTSVGTT